MKKLLSIPLISIGAILLMASVAGANEGKPPDHAGPPDKTDKTEIVEETAETQVIEPLKVEEVVEEIVVAETKTKVDKTPIEVEEPQKVFVCKYVGTPGVDEVLQTGNNPISVSVNAIKNYDGVGSYFNDAHGRSFVLAEDNRTGGGQEGEPGIDGCPAPVGPPPPVDVCPNLDGDQGTVPDGYNTDANGDCVEEIPPCDVTDPKAECYVPPIPPEPPVVEPPVIEPPVVEPPVIVPPSVVEPVDETPPVIVVEPTPEPVAPMATARPVVESTQLAATGSNDSLPALALSGFGLLVLGLAMTRKAARL